MEKAIWIQKGHADYDGLKWTIKATKPISDEGENILIHLEIKDSIATGCDGKRLHEYTLNAPEHFPNGIYRPFISKDNLIFILNESGQTYPATISLFPSEEPIKKLQVTVGKGALFDWVYTQIVRNLSESYTLQIGFIQKMLEGGINWDIGIFCEGKVCLFMTPGKRGLIMPVH